MVVFNSLLVDNLSMNIFLELTDQYGSQKKVAELIGVSESAYSDWVNGHKLPRVKNIEKITALSDKSRSEILESIYRK